MSGGGGVGDSVMMTNLIPTYIPSMQDWAVSYLEQSLALAVDNFAAYSGSTYAAQNSAETNGIAALATRGSAGSAIEAHGETYLQALFAGTYIGANPYLDDAFQKLVDEAVQEFEEETLPDIEAAHAFSFGGSEHNVDEARAAEKLIGIINGIAEKIYFDDHVVERKVQDAGLDHAIPYGQRAIRDGEILRSAGVYAREYLQGQYKDNWAKWNEAQIIHTRNLDIMGNAIRTIIGTSRTTSTKYYKPPAVATMAGLALSGLSIYTMSKHLSMSAYDNPAGKKSVSIPEMPFLPGLPSLESFQFGGSRPDPNVIDLVPQDGENMSGGGTTYA